jgi:hypothetical protein
MSHFILKLTSGEFVYGTINPLELDEKMLVIDNPLVWEDYEMEDGRHGTALVKYMTGTKETKIPIAISAVVSMAAMSPSFENMYEAAVAVQKITDESYDEKIVYMTKRMIDLVMDYQAREQAAKTDGIIMTAADTDTTIH